MATILEKLRTEGIQVDWSKELVNMKPFDILLSNRSIAYIEVDLMEKPLMKEIDMTNKDTEKVKKQKYFYLGKVKFLRLLDKKYAEIDIKDNLRWQFGVMIYIDLLPLFTAGQTGRAIIEIFKKTERTQNIKVITAEEYAEIEKLSDSDLKEKFPKIEITKVLEQDTSTVITEIEQSMTPVVSEIP